MAINKLTTSGKYTTAGNWSGGKPVAATEIEVPAAKTVEVTSASACRAAILEGTINGSLELNIGDATAPTEAVLKELALKIIAGASFAGAFNVNFVSTAATVLGITTGGVSIAHSGTWTVKTGKYRFEDNFNANSITKLLVEAELKGNAKTITVPMIEGRNGAGATIDLTNSTAVLNEWAPETGNVITTTGSTIEINNAKGGGNFSGNSRTYNVTRLVNRKAQLGGSNTHAELKFDNEGTAATGITVSQGTTQTFTVLNFKGKAGELARVESNEAAKAWKLKSTADYEPANSFVAVKDCTYEGGTLYLPHGEDLGGNTNIKFEAKPGGVVSGKATGAILLTGAASGSAKQVVSGKATGPILLAGSSTATVKNAVLGQATGTLVLTGTSKGTVAGALHGKATGALVLTGTAKATLAAVVSGKATGPILLTGISTGQRFSRTTAKATGVLLLMGSAKGSVSGNVVGKASGALRFGGSASSGTGAAMRAKVTVTNWTATRVHIINRKPTDVQVVNRKSARVEVSRS